MDIFWYYAISFYVVGQNDSQVKKNPLSLNPNYSYMMDHLIGVKRQRKQPILQLCAQLPGLGKHQAGLELTLL